jgi:tRNA threonylcarbamoyladenosine biosynthesis protein TsaB
MNLLAIETSTELGSIALWCDGDVLRAVSARLGISHSETLLPLICGTLLRSRAGLCRPARVAFAAGPGSFTGLRVACGVAQGLAFAHELPVVPVGTLDAMALASGGEQVIVVLDARMGEVYYGRFSSCDATRRGGGLPADRPCRFPTRLAGWPAVMGSPPIPLLRARLAGLRTGWQPELMPDAGAVACLAAPRLARGEGIDAAAAAPLYVRNKVALTVAERLAKGGKA